MPEHTLSSDSPATPRSRGVGKSLLLGAFALANAGLLASLFLGRPASDPAALDLSALDFASVAHAQQAGDAQLVASQQAGRPSEYLLLPVKLSNIDQEVVYILDTQSGFMTAAAYDNNDGLRFVGQVALFPNR